MKILFQGDSITDAWRDRENPHDMGEGYPHYASAMLRDVFPDVDFEFINLGIGGDRTTEILARLESDIIEQQPDIVSLLVGINDVWHRYLPDIGRETTDEQFEENLRTILSAIKERTSACILLMEPFLLEEVDPQKSEMTEELVRKQAIVRRLGEEYADAYLPLHKYLHTAAEEQSFYSADGVHLTADGACAVGEVYLGAITPLVELLTKEA